MRHHLCVTLVLLLAYLSLSASAAHDKLNLTQDQDQFTVTACGKKFVINKKPYPNWGRHGLIFYGKDGKQGIYTNTVAKSDTSPKAHYLPTQQDAQFRLLTHNDQSIVIRGSYPLCKVGKPKERCQHTMLVAYYTFTSALPAVAVDLRAVALNNDRVAIELFCTTFSGGYEAYTVKGKKFQYDKGSWQNLPVKGASDVLAEKKGEQMYLRPVAGHTPDKGFYCTGANQWKVVTPDRGKFAEMNLLVGYPKNDNVRDMVAFRNSVRLEKDNEDDELVARGLVDGKLEARPAPQTMKIGDFSAWKDLPVMVVRNKLKDYRPAEANNWKGADDLSFQAQSTFDAQNLYLRITVNDNRIKQTAKGTDMWMGDCIQIAFDPQNAQELTKDFILLGVTPGPGPKTCCWSHGNQQFVGRNNLDDILKTHVTRTDRGYDCEMAIPWTFLSPFKLSHGQIGFNIVVLDKNGGNWMGITDGIAGGKFPDKYQKLIFKGFEQGLFAGQKAPRPELLPALELVDPEDRHTQFSMAVFVQQRDLPAELVLATEKQELAAHELKQGFNTFPLAANLYASLQGPHELQLFLRAKGQRQHLRRLQMTFVSKTWLNRQSQEARQELNAYRKQLERLHENYGRQEPYLMSRAATADYFIRHVEHMLSHPKTYTANFRREYANLCYVRNLLKEGAHAMKRMLAGDEKPMDYPPLTNKLRPVIRKGGFYIGNRERFFIGPNTWNCSTADWIEILGESGLNLVNYFWGLRWPEEKKWELAIAAAEKHGVYANLRDTVGSGGYQLQESGWDRQKKVNLFKETPSLFYIVSHEEGHAFPKDRDRLFQNYLKDTYGTIQALNDKVGMKLKAFEEVTRDIIHTNLGLNYESYLFWSQHYLNKGLKDMGDIRHRRWKLPISTHLSELMFSPYNTVGNVGDFDFHWNYFDIVSFDAGVSRGITKDYALNFSCKALLLTDMGRSFYPDKPIANNEEYSVPVGNLALNADESYHYATAMLPMLHGRNASSIFVFNPYLNSRYPNTTWDRAEGFFQTAKATLDANRFPEAVAAFRTLTSPIAILYSIPAYGDKNYPDYITDAYEGINFGPFPCRFISDQRVLKGDLKNHRILVVTKAVHMRQDVFEAICDFTEKGGRVLIFGQDSFTRDPYGKLITGRKARLKKHITYLTDGLPRTYFNAIYRLLADIGETILPAMTSPEGKPIFGVESRRSKTPDGTDVIYAVNLLHQKKTVKLPAGRWLNLWADRPQPTVTQLKPLDILLLKRLD